MIKKNKLNIFLNARTIAFLSAYLAIMIILNFTPQLGYVNVGFTSFTTMIIPITFISIHYGYRGALFGWIMFGFLYFAQVFISFAGIINFIGIVGAFIVYCLGKIITGFFMSIILIIFEKIEIYKSSKINKWWLWLSFKVVIIATLGSIINGFIFMILWYAMDPYKSLTTLSIFLVNFGLAFAIEIPLTITISISSIPLLSYINKVEKNYKENSY